MIYCVWMGTVSLTWSYISSPYQKDCRVTEARWLAVEHMNKYMHKEQGLRRMLRADTACKDRKAQEVRAWSVSGVCGLGGCGVSSSSAWHCCCRLAFPCSMEHGLWKGCVHKDRAQCIRSENTRWVVMIAGALCHMHGHCTEQGAGTWARRQ